MAMNLIWKNTMLLKTMILIIIVMTFHIVQIFGSVFKPKAPRVLLVSFDGFRWDYLSTPETKDKTPNFHKLMSEGVYAKKGIKNAFITKTFPNHYTIVTGLYEESHGIVGNTMFDPDLNQTFEIENREDQRSSKWFDNGGEPIWVTNELQDNCLCRKSGIMFWPGEEAPVKGVLPYKYIPYDGTLSNKTRIDTIVRWFTDDYPVNLGLLYFEEPDEIGHQKGPDSLEVKNMIIALDEILGYLITQLKEKKIYDTTDIIITSDHGMASTPKSKVIDLDIYISPSDYRIFTSTPIANILPNKGKEDEIYEKLKNANIPNLKVYKKDDIPEEFHYKHNRRIQPILIVPDEGYSLTHNQLNYSGRGDHGYNNSFPDMHPFFIARGPSFKKNHTIETFDNVDIYPLMCEILGLKPAPNNGSLDNVKSLLAFKTDSKKTESDSFLSYDSTFLNYIIILLFIAMIAGIFSIAACRQQRIHRHRKLRLSSLSPMTMQLKYTSTTQPTNGGKQPLLEGTDTEDEF